MDDFEVVRELAFSLVDLCMALQAKVEAQSVFISAITATVVLGEGGSPDALRQHVLHRAGFSADSLTDENRAKFQAHIAEMLEGLDRLR
jgi:hypothetical protein